MLYLTRRISETVIIYEGDRKIAEVTILGVRGRQIRIGLDADKEISFVRAELIQNSGNAR